MSATALLKLTVESLMYGKRLLPVARGSIDLQYVVQGAEGMGCANIQHLQQGEYDASKDFLPLFGEGDQVSLKSGCFVLLFPEDAHMPGMAIGEPAFVRKIVLKIAVE